MLASYLFLFYSLRRVQTFTAFDILSIAYYLQAFLSRLQSVLILCAGYKLLQRLIYYLLLIIYKHFCLDYKVSFFSIL